MPPNAAPPGQDVRAPEKAWNPPRISGATSWNHECRSALSRVQRSADLVAAGPVSKKKRRPAHAFSSNTPSAIRAADTQAGQPT